MTNQAGETLAWHRATTTARIQPIGILVPESRKGTTSALQALLRDIRLESRPEAPVVLDAQGLTSRGAFHDVSFQVRG